MSRKGKRLPRITRGWAMTMVNGNPLKVKVVGDPHVLDRERVVEIELPNIGVVMTTPVAGLTPIVAVEEDGW